MTYLLFKAFWYLLAALGIGFFLGYRLRSADADELEGRLRRDIADRDRRLSEAMRIEGPSEPKPVKTEAVQPDTAPETAPDTVPAERGPSGAAAAASEPVASEVSRASATTVQPEAAVFAAPTGSAPDDLKRIKGVGPKLEAELNGLGITTFAQIAAFGEADLQRLDDALTAFKGRAVRDDWVGQAAALVSEG